MFFEKFRKVANNSLDILTDVVTQIKRKEDKLEAEVQTAIQRIDELKDQTKALERREEPDLEMIRSEMLERFGDVSKRLKRVDDVLIDVTVDADSIKTQIDSLKVKTNRIRSLFLQDISSNCF